MMGVQPFIAIAPEGYLCSRILDLEKLVEIVELERAAFANPWSQVSLSTEIINPLNLTSVIRSKSTPEILGYSLIRIIPPEAELLRIAVKPYAQGVGVGAMLLGESLKKLLDFQLNQVFLEVSEKNSLAIALYKKAGFSVENRRPSYYDNGTTGAIIMVLDV
ncbi:ribosomal protein S18-alanine N-acetyltransferase [bacterium]|nr:ribosomal protein S18-alanine N-acetyltransferase [bacterium]